MKTAITELKIKLETLINNEPIYRAEGNNEQADLCAKSAAEISSALGVLCAPKQSNMRAKLKIESITKNEYNEELKFSAVYGNSTNKEDNTFSEATPSASLTMVVSNKELHGKFKPGQKFYVDFTEAAD